MRTFYWQPPAATKRQRLRRWLRSDREHPLAVGNAGDLFNRDVVRLVYGTTAMNVADEGRRLLLIGSVAHTIHAGDIVCGVGTKGKPIPSAMQVDCSIVGVRGPITLEAMARAGHDTSGVRFQLDPGLLIRHVVPDAPAERGRVAFVPHYRERHFHRERSRQNLSLVDIDADPVDVARQIQASELVFASSLHGLIFAHALGRPCVLVAPQTAEPEIKYQDYFASVGLPWRRPPTLDEALRAPTPTSPRDVSFQLRDFTFPQLAELQARGIAEA